MNKPSKIDSEIQALRERVSRLSAAVPCINSSLDLDTVLHEILAGTRDLVGARYGLITTINETGQPQDSVPSGFSPEDERLPMECLPGCISLSTSAIFQGRSGWQTCPSISTLSATSRTRCCRRPSRRPRCVTATCMWEPSSSERSTVGNSSPMRTRGFWCCSPPKRRPLPPTHARSGTSSGAVQPGNSGRYLAVRRHGL